MKFSAFLLTLTLGYSGMVQLQEKNNFDGPSQLVVRYESNGQPPFAEGARVQVLETFLHSVLGQLIYLDGDYNLKPGLLESFTWQERRKSYLLNLKPGIKFHNGRTVTSKDLEFSLVRGFFTPSGNWYKAFFSNIEGIDAAKGKKYQSGLISGVQVVNQHSVEVKLKKPNPSFLHSLARSYFSLVPQEELEADLTKWKRFPIGAGQYRVVDVSTSSTLLRKANQIQSGVNEIVFTNQPTEIDPDISFMSHPKLKVTELERVSSVTGIWFNYLNAHGARLDFRRWIDSMIDRDQIVQGVAAYQPSKELLPEVFWGRISQDTNSSKIDGNFDEVPKLRIPVFGAGFGDPVLGQYIKHLKQLFASYEVEVEFIKTSKKILDEKDKDIPFYITGLGADLADPLVLFNLFRKGSPLWPLFDKNDQEYVELCQKAENAASIEEKRKWVSQLSSYFYEQRKALPLFFKKELIYVNPNTVKDLGRQDGGLTVYLNRVKK